MVMGEPAAAQDPAAEILLQSRDATQQSCVPMILFITLIWGTASETDVSLVCMNRGFSGHFAQLPIWVVSVEWVLGYRLPAKVLVDALAAKVWPTLEQ